MSAGPGRGVVVRAGRPSPDVCCVYTGGCGNKLRDEHSLVKEFIPTVQAPPCCAPKVANSDAGRVQSMHDVLSETDACVCDVGCGSGDGLKLLAKAYPQARFFGYEFRADTVAEANEDAARCVRGGGEGTVAPPCVHRFVHGAAGLGLPTSPSSKATQPTSVSGCGCTVGCSTVSTGCNDGYGMQLRLACRRLTGSWRGMPCMTCQTRRRSPGPSSGH